MLFIYGTLLSGARNRHIIEPLIEWWEPATARGTLHLHGKYPLFFPGEGEVVGELVLLENEPRALAHLDEFEGPEYRRVEIDVTIESGAGKAWTYIYHDDSPPAGALPIGGDWIKYSDSAN